jgi:hypothetical protein
MVMVMVMVTMMVMVVAMAMVMVIMMKSLCECTLHYRLVYTAGEQLLHSGYRDGDSMESLF